MFLLSLHWMSLAPAARVSELKAWVRAAQTAGTIAFLLLLAVQPLDLVGPLYRQMSGVPYSRSADVARILQEPQLSRAIVMADPDVMLEPLPYYAANPLWFLREAHFGPLFLRTRADRQQIHWTQFSATRADCMRRPAGRWFSSVTFNFRTFGLSGT